MKKINIFFCAAIIVFSANIVFAFSDYARKEKLSCAKCHISPAGSIELSDTGKTYATNKAFATVQTDVDAGAQAKYLGANKCKMCHSPIYKSWAETKHANAFKVLVDKQSDKNAECIVCHTAGYNLTGGYTENADNLKNVTCEACHGPGSLHMSAKKEDKKKMINGKPGEKLCRSCHNEKQSPNFKFEEYSKKGLHAITVK